MHGHGIYPRKAHESGGAPADRHRFNDGTDSADDRLHHLEPIRGAVQKKHGDSADRIHENRAWAVMEGTGKSL